MILGLFLWGSVIFKMCYFFPRKKACSSWNFSCDGVPLCWQKHNCPHFEKEDNMNETEAFITQVCGTIIGIVPKSCVMNASVSFTLSSFSKWGQLCFCQHSCCSMERRQIKSSRCIKPSCGGKISTFWKWHCLRKIALEWKRLIYTWWTVVFN